MNNETVWLYHNGSPLQSVLMPVGATEEAIKQKALRELEACPSVFCEQYELPDERRSKIIRATIQF